VGLVDTNSVCTPVPNACIIVLSLLPIRHARSMFPLCPLFCSHPELKFLHDCLFPQRFFSSLTAMLEDSLTFWLPNDVAFFLEAITYIDLGPFELVRNVIRVLKLEARTSPMIRNLRGVTSNISSCLSLSPSPTPPLISFASEFCSLLRAL